MNAHRQLIAWQRCQDLAVAVYGATRAFPREEQFGITRQMRRAAVSASSNLAEGYGRPGRKELLRFIGISLGSLSEVDSLISLSERLGYLSSPQATELNEAREVASKITFGLSKRPGR